MRRSLRQTLPVKPPSSETRLRIVKPAFTMLPPAPADEQVASMSLDDLVMFFARQSTGTGG